MGIRGQQGAPLLGTIRHQGRRSGLLWLMALLLFVQALIPIQSHTRWAVADDGRVLELCTLHGTVLVDADTGQPLAEQEQDQSRSPAMAFSQLLASAVSGHAAVQPAWLALVAIESPPAVIGVPTRRTLRLAHIRAPPALI
jgi:hypothetical protein